MWRRLVLITLVWFALILSLSALADLTLPAAPASDYTGVAAYSGHARLVTPLVRFDALHYLTIADHGYIAADPGLKAFFPLYPLTLKVAASPVELVRHHSALGYAMAGVLLNIVLVAVGLWVMVRLFELDIPRPFGLIGAVTALLLPYSFFLAAPYTEALFLVLSVSSFYAARRGKWWLAGLLAGLASLTRLPGLLLLPALAVEYLHQAKWDLRRLKPSLAWLALSPLGALAYFAYLARSGGGLAAYTQAYHASWPERQFDLNIFAALLRPVTQAAHTGHLSLNTLMALGLFVAIVALLVATWRELRPSYRAYAVLGLILPLLTTTLDSVGRYYGLIFPVYLMLAIVGRRRPYLLAGTLVASLMFGSLLLVLFTKGYFVG